MIPVSKSSMVMALCAISALLAAQGALAQALKPAPSVGPSAVEVAPAGPGWFAATPVPIPSEQVEAHFRARGKPQIDVPIAPATRVSASNIKNGALQKSFAAPDVPANVAELARSLKNDPDLIFQHVRNNIEFYPIWGVQKGSVGALIDGSGTAFDQALLLRDLLVAAGYPSTLVRGKVWIPAADAAAWLGVETANYCTVIQRLAGGGYSVTRYNESGTGTCKPFEFIEIDHVRVRVTIAGAAYVFDPSFKPRAAKAGINVASIAGYTRAAFLASAGTGATSTPDYVQTVNRNAIRSSLTTYASTLATHIRSTNPHGAVHDVLGGPGPITPYWGPNLRNTTLPTCSYPFSAICQVAAPVEMTDGNPTAANNIDNYRATLQVQYRGINKTFTSDAIYGKRLSLTFTAAGLPQLWLDGVLQASGTSSAPVNVSENISFSIRHLAYGGFNQDFTQSVRTGTSDVYVISQGWGPSGAGTLAHFQRKLAEAKASGAADGSEAVMGAAVAVLSAQWIAQVSASNDLLDRIKRQQTLWHHGVGIAGYSNATMYVDLPGNYSSFAAADGSQTDSTGFYSSMFPLSVLESTSVQQVAGILAAASTVSLIDKAVASNSRIYNVTSANIAAVRSLLSGWGCSAYAASVDGAIAAGRRLVMPANCAIAADQWSGAGYFTIGANQIGAIINGSVPATAAVKPTPPAPSPVFAGALAGGQGSFKTSSTDISVGVGNFPASLALQRSYSSDSNLQNGTLGRGWSHNLGGSARTVKAGLRAYGEGTALDAVANIVTSAVMLDLMSDTSRPLMNVVAATVASKWASEQLEDTAVEVRVGTASESFIKLPDGTFNPPRGSSARLTQAAGAFTYESKDRTTLAFNTAGELTSYTLKNGLRAQFAYIGGRLDTATNSLGRSIKLTYDANNRIATAKAVGNASDTVGRTVTYGYTSGNLTSFTNALSQTTSFSYNAANRLEKVFADPAASTVATLTIAYDGLGRMSRQTDVAGKVTNFYFAGSRSEVEAPLSVRTIAFYNWQGLPVRSIDAVGRTTVTDYDAAGRSVKVTAPEGNAVEYTYDDATCNSAEKRCTHNVLTTVSRPKPGSTLTALTTTNTYEASFNKLASTTNPRGHKTEYTYHALSGEVATITQPAAVTSGVQPQTTYVYSPFTPAGGWPTFYLQTSETRRIDSVTNTTTTSRTFDAANSYVPLTVVVDSGAGKLNLTNTFTYDAVGNLTVEDGPRTDVIDTTTRVYDALRRATEVRDAAGKATRTAYDGKGRPVRSATQVGTQWLVSCTDYWPTDLPKRQWGPVLMASDVACPTQVAPAPLTDRVYDNLGRLASETVNLTAAEGGSRTTTYAYFADGQVQSVTKGTGIDQVIVSYTYTTNGKPLTLRDGRNNLSTYEYDGFDRLNKLRYPVKETTGATAGTSSTTDFEQFTYDANGNVTAQRLRNGASISQPFDNLDRVTQRTFANAADNVSFSYDLLSRRLTASRTDHAMSYTWDNAGRLRSATAGGRTIGYQYDPAGNRTRITWPDSFYVTTSYDVLNRPVSIKENGSVNLVTSYLYDDMSRRTVVTLGNGTTTSYSYGAQGALGGVAHDLAGTANDVSVVYTRNQVLDIASQTITSTNTAYRWNPPAASSKTYVSNGANQYSSVAGVSFAYDSLGNLTGDGTWTWSYDDASRLKSAVTSGGNVALVYDGVGRLRQETWNTTTTTQFLYDDTDLIAEFNNAGTLLRRHVHGPGIDEPIVTYEGAGTANKSWLYADHQGSIVAVANATGAGTAAHSYGPFGQPNVATGSRFKYTGQVHMPNLGLYYYKARFYSPTLGRFLQPDPSGYVDGPNLYAYVGNNPTNLVDPTGQWAEEHHGGFGGVKQAVTSVAQSVGSFVESGLGAARSAYVNTFNAFVGDPNAGYVQLHHYTDAMVPVWQSSARGPRDTGFAGRNQAFQAIIPMTSSNPSDITMRKDGWEKAVERTTFRFNQGVAGRVGPVPIHQGFGLYQPATGNTQVGLGVPVSFSNPLTKAGPTEPFFNVRAEVKPKNQLTQTWFTVNWGIDTKKVGIGSNPTQRTDGLKAGGFITNHTKLLIGIPMESWQCIGSAVSAGLGGASAIDCR